MHIYGKITHVHLPYKSVTGRHTYVIYLMFFNIHAYLGFIRFTEFSVWPAEMGEIKADGNILFKCSPTSCKAWNQLRSTFVAVIRSLPWPRPSLPPRGGPSLTGTRGSAVGKEQTSQQREACCLTGSLADVPEETVPVQETRSKTVQVHQAQPVPNTSPSSDVLPAPLPPAQSSLDLSISGNPQPFRHSLEPTGRHIISRPTKHIQHALCLRAHACAHVHERAYTRAHTHALSLLPLSNLPVWPFSLIFTKFLGTVPFLLNKNSFTALFLAPFSFSSLWLLGRGPESTNGGVS